MPTEGDPELDQWLAVNLMDWHVFVDAAVPEPLMSEYRSGPAHEGPCEHYDDEDQWVGECQDGNFLSWGDIAWVPSDRIWHAEPVWEKMRAAGWKISVHSLANGIYEVTFEKFIEGLGLIHVGRDNVSFSFAVSLAARRALEAAKG